MTAQTQSVTPATRILGSRALLLPGLFILLALLVLCVLWSITLGAAQIDTQVVYEALFNYNDTDFNHLIIQTVRLPRALAGVIVGASLAVAGALMQGQTRNPLADGGLLGINSGAAFAVVLGVVLLGNPSLYAIFGFIGAAVAAALVYMLGSMGRGGMMPLKLTLAGVIMSTFLASFTTAILIHDQETLDKIRFWTAGSLAGREMSLLIQTAPYMLVGLIGALIVSRQITTMSLGEDIAKGLGQNSLWVKGIAAIIVVLLNGGAVALAGPVGFVGLVVPHVVRFVVGVDYRWIIPYSAILGGVLVTVADVGARVIIRPQELPVGVMMAIVGAPFFIWLARRQLR